MRINFDGKIGTEIVVAWSESGSVQVIDTNGVSYERVVRCDTRTGEIVTLRRTEAGSIVIFKGEPLEDHRIVPAPLKVVFEKLEFK